MAAVSIEDLEARQTEIKSELRDLDEQYRGEALPDEEREKWNRLNEEHDENEKKIDELKARHERIEELATSSAHREDGASFQSARPRATRGDDVFDLTTIRSSVSNPEEAAREMRDRALRVLETATFPHERANREDCQSYVARLLDLDSSPDAEVARRILITGSPLYRRAFGKYLKGQALFPEETRALSIGTGSAGGFAVVFTLDPTIIPTSNLSVNPWRAISSVEMITGTNEWRGVTSAGVTAARVAEATEATDNAPTLAQPALIVSKVHVFIPFSIEVGADWAGLQSEMARMIQDAKDDEEATAFATGNGTAPNPQGVITGATTTVTAGGVASFAVADVYKLWEALPARFRPRAVYVSNLFIADKIRQFDTSGGASIWVQNLQLGIQGAVPSPGNYGASLLGRPYYESTAMASALTTGSKILIVGDFSYYKIVDRVGLDIEVVPHLFGATNRFPTGQRGLYAYWRNYGKVLDVAAFRVLVTG